MSKTIAIMNQKGGVGKTTTTVNLGAALAAKSFRVLLVDLDPSGSMSSWLDGGESGELSGLGDLFFGRVGIDGALRNSEILGLDYIPSGKNLRDVLPKGSFSIYSLSEIVRDLKNRYDFMLFDCPPSSDFLIGNALVAADSIIIPIQTESLPLQSGVRFLDWIDTFINTQNCTVDILGILPCMFDSRTRLSNNILESMKASENLGPLVFDTVIRKNVRLAEIAGTGKSIVKSASSSFGAEDYDRLADEIVERTGLAVSASREDAFEKTDGDIDESMDDLVSVGAPISDDSHDSHNQHEEPLYRQPSYNPDTGNVVENGEN